MKNPIKEYKNYRYAVKNGLCLSVTEAAKLTIEYYLQRFKEFLFK